MIEIHTAAHVAYLDPMTGSGMLVCPVAETDVLLPTSPEPVTLPDGIEALRMPLSLHAADWEAMGCKLAAIGWDLLIDGDDGGWIDEGVTCDGRSVVALIGDESIIDHPTIEQLASVRIKLASAAGLLT